MKQFLINRKQASILACLGNGIDTRTESKLSRILIITPLHIHKLIKEYEILGLIYTSKSGRIKNCYLTKKGKEVLFHLQKIINLIEE